MTRNRRHDVFACLEDMRNMVAHGYDAVDLDIIWDTATSEVPTLRRQLDELISIHTK